MDSLTEGVVVFDRRGELLYMNQPAESAVQTLCRDVPRSARDLMPQFAEVGARVAPLKVGDEDIGEAVKEFKAGKIELRNDSSGNVHAPVGKLSFSGDALQGNIRELIGHLERVKPTGCRGRYMKGVVLSTTMGPGIKVKA